MLSPDSCRLARWSAAGVEAQDPGVAITFGSMVGDESAEGNLVAAELAVVVVVPGFCVLVVPVLVEAADGLGVEFFGFSLSFGLPRPTLGELVDLMLRLFEVGYVHEIPSTAARLAVRRILD